MFSSAQTDESHAEPADLFQFPGGSEATKILR
jgi:hypothetical protein